MQEEELTEDIAGYTGVHWKLLSRNSRIYWARWFCVPNEDAINEVLIKTMGPEIIEPCNSVAYDIGYEKIKSWSRQWQYDILKRLILHVCSAFPLS